MFQQTVLQLPFHRDTSRCLVCVVLGLLLFVGGVVFAGGIQVVGPEQVVSVALKSVESIFSVIFRPQLQ